VQPAQHEAADTTAKLMLLLLSLAWGLTWPAMRVALGEIPVFSMRTVSLGLGALTLVIVVAAQRRKVTMPNAAAWAHVFVAAILNIVGFSLLSSFALLQAATSRVAILSYTMPIWAALFAWLLLGERFNRGRIIALALCVAGMAMLIFPLAGAGIPIGLLLALGTGVSWAAGTVYLKWARIDADPIVVAAWQLVIGFLVVVIALAFVEGGLHLTQAHLPACVRDGVHGLGWIGARVFSLVQDRRAPAGDDGVARHIECAGGRRDVDRGVAGRMADRARHGGLCADLRGVDLCVAALARGSGARAGVTCLSLSPQAGRG
jgi:drug/metabolite transporter (DMT)-like permease